MASQSKKAIIAALAGNGRFRVIPIAYVNSSAGIKAFVGEHGGACCTSTNALDVFSWALAGGTEPARSSSSPPFWPTCRTRR